MVEQILLFISLLPFLAIILIFGQKKFHGILYGKLENLFIPINIILNAFVSVGFSYPWLNFDDGSTAGLLLFLFLESITSAIILWVFTAIVLILIKRKDFKIKKILFAFLISTIGSIVASPILFPLAIFVGLFLNCIFYSQCGW